jgi:hypothetical protein
MTEIRFAFKMVWPALALGIGLISPAVQAQSSDAFAQIQGQYMSMLNLRADKDRLQAIPAFSAKLTALALSLRAQYKSGSLKDPSAREHAGLVLIYDGLLTVNNTNAAISGVIPLSDLKAAHVFGKPGADDRAELLARAKHVIEDMELAAKLRPEDHRIDSWLAAAKINKQKIKTGRVSKKALTASLNAIPTRPTFNLWTSFLLLREQPADSKLFVRLVGEAKSFVDKIKEGKDPCKERPRDCLNGNLAPFNFQASIVELGDVFLRRAESLLAAGDIPHAMEMAAYAKGSYANLDKPEHTSETKSWPDYLVLTERLARVSSVQSGHAAGPLLAQTDNYLRPYECSSCHGR